MTLLGILARRLLHIAATVVLVALLIFALMHFLPGDPVLMLLGERATDAGIAQMAVAGVQVNLMLMALNLLPILPLDGGRVAVSLLPHRIAAAYARLERYGFVLVIILLVTGILGDLMQPLLRLGTYAVTSITGL